MNAQEIKKEVERILEMFMDGLITSVDAANATYLVYSKYKE